MSHRMLRLTLLLVCAVVVSAQARAQDFSVYTQIYNEYESSKKPANPPITRSRSLFHAGRVFDFPTGSQVAIFEPSHSRFIIIDWTGGLITEISFDEINERIYRDEKKLLQHIQEMQADRHRDAPKLASHLQFQVTPRFKESYDEAKHLLTLSSSQLNYEVTCDDAQPAEIIDVYLRYTDWAARLSAISRPHSLLPGPRLALDDVLRRRKLLPTEVVLRSAPFPQLHLKAMHKFIWQLDVTDRNRISEWDEKSRGTELERVPFDTFLKKTAVVAENKPKTAR
jgi:hypothetical protein